MKNNVERFDYRLIVTDLNNPSPRSGGVKITNYNEMIKGETYGYNAMVDWCSKMNKDYPAFSHSVQKWSDYEAHEKYMGRL